MTKLPKNKKFIDFSDYARPLAEKLVKILLPTKVGAYTLTFLFMFVGLIASYLIYNDKYLIIAAFLLLIKSLLDAADGEIARQRNEPSMVGRYLDSVFDFLLNVIIFFSIASVFKTNIRIVLVAILLYHLQGSIYNYYYLLKRYQVNGDKTSRLFEWETPKPFVRDNKTLLKILHKLYLIIYVWQDYLIYKIDSNAIHSKELPSWFLSSVSFLGLGFQLLVIAVFLILEFKNTYFIGLFFHTQFLQ
ncbi:MAG: CDP-alcohol phosphatidyltransferase family protein [Ignavibacteriales bacterium]|nr:CDP-alcohol phosphatidyltransferase family protein [Ignavibacteriales bacterium]